MCICQRRTSEQVISRSHRRDDDIALLAAEQLGVLASRLLSRAELSHFTHQVRSLPRFRFSE